MIKQEIYISTDIEADGPVPGLYSMLSFGSAAFLADKTLLSTFSRNLETLPGAQTCPKTMKWWQGQKAAWEACRKNQESPDTALKAYLEWLKQFNGRIVFVSFPVCFDYNFISWYLLKFTGQNPFGYDGLDLKTYAMAILKKDFGEISKNRLPKEWFDTKNRNTHIALEDAIEQGEMFCNMLKSNLEV